MKLSKKSAGNIFCLTDQKSDNHHSTVPKSYIILDIMGQTFLHFQKKCSYLASNLVGHLTNFFFHFRYVGYLLYNNAV